MSNLSNHQKKFLRSLGHHLNPYVMIGQKGLTDSAKDEIQSTLFKHELIKIKIRVGDREEKNTAINEIVNITNSSLVQSVGNTILIYRPFEKDPQIILPKK